MTPKRLSALRTQEQLAIKAVVLECPKCRRRVTCGLDSLTYFPDYCDCAPKGAAKIPIGKDSDVQMFLNVVTGLNTKTNVPLILLEFDEPH
jgi:hypothetical protein